ncbi:hypothetical protein [Nocardia sp. alder85J]|uniref:Rv1733c family protein n=1 Tax=Nocardia sp. alder85J TaxID=2862949 RepID=UPI001CD43509|nr:hypothetical protein [Nocardia sp. alder85J]MCX4095515.1 hypothetical protein [Nocardia sp. alder85J]
MTSANTNGYKASPRPWWTLRAWRNPLMPTGYRARYLLRLFLVILATAAIPAAVTVGVGQFHRLETDAGHQRAALHRVDAVADGDATTVGSGIAVAQSHWTYAGVAHTGSVPVRSSTHGNDRIPILVNANGDRATEPPTRDQNMGDAILLGILAFAGALLAMAMAAWVADYQIDRYRSHRWSREWQLLSTDRRWNLR